MKKIVALLLVLAMVMSFAACGNQNDTPVEPTGGNQSVENQPSVKEEEPKEPVEIHYWYNNVAGPQEYTQQVEDALNEILKVTEGYEHITIKLHPCKDYATDIALAQANGDPMDIVSTPGLNVSAEIENGAWLPLDDLLAANPEVTADLPEWFMEYGKVDGTTWFVPNYQQMANQFFWYTPKELLDNSRYTYEEAKAIILSKDVDKIAEFYENYILDAREYLKSDTVFLNGDRLSITRMWVQPSNDITNVDWNGVFYWDEEAEKINFSLLNENIQAGFIKTGELYAKGIMDTKSQLEGLTSQEFLTDRSFVFEFCQSYGTEEMVAEVQSNALGYDVYAINCHEYVFLSNSNAAGGTAISSTTSSPEDAAKVLALLFNGKYADFYNQLIFGFEGIHYEWVNKETNQIKTLEFDGANAQAGTTYAFQKWRGGNTFNAWLNQSQTPEQRDYILNEINEGESTVKIPLMGFTLNTAPVESELSQIKAVIDEYQTTLMNGYAGADAEAMLAEYLNKLELAGLSKVLEEFNAQADEFLGR